MQRRRASRRGTAGFRRSPAAPGRAERGAHRSVRSPRREPGSGPRRQRRVATSPRRRRRPGSSPLVGVTILVVDDHEDSRMVLKQMLTAVGASVRLARDGHEGLAQIGVPPPPNVILCDLLMPGMDGVSFARRLKTQPRWAPIPIIAVTALGQPTDYVTTWSQGFKAHVTKPVDADELIGVIRRFVEHPRGRRPRPTR